VQREKQENKNTGIAVFINTFLRNLGFDKS
jgi:hypothetical protein